MPTIVYVVMIENNEGIRGCYGVYADEPRASRASYDASHLHFKAWYEPRQLEGATTKQEQPECAQT